MSWLEPGELRLGLGCMRLAAAEAGGDPNGLETIVAAAQAGVTVFDTAHVYGRDEEAGQNERLVAAALRAAGSDRRPRVVTKGGMTRAGGAWVPDGRARAIRADCEASLSALSGHPVDLYLLHAPDPRTPWATSVRALRRLVDEGLVSRIGLSNVNRFQLEQALEIAPISAVEVALSVFDDQAVRGGVLELCERRDVAFIAHSPLGGHRRRGLPARSEPLRALAAELGATPAEVALAWLLDLSPLVVAIPGARSAESARSAVRAAAVRLDGAQTARLEAALGLARSPARRPAPSNRAAPEVVLIMGIPGAGKSRLAETYAARGFVRLNRDERGGSLLDLAGELDRRLGDGARRVVLDNTYLTRAARSRVIGAAVRQGAQVRCVWLDTPLAQAQVNLVERLLDRFGSLPEPDVLRGAARREPGLHSPTSQMRTLRDLEPPGQDEGFSEVVRLPFRREPHSRPSGSAVFVAAAALPRPAAQAALEALAAAGPYLVFDWCPDASGDVLESARKRLARLAGGVVEAAVCRHPGGPPVCWCRPPLPGLLLEFARRHGVDPARSTVVGATRTHRTLAAALGARYVEV